MGVAKITWDFFSGQAVGFPIKMKSNVAIITLDSLMYPMPLEFHIQLWPLFFGNGGFYESNVDDDYWIIPTFGGHLSRLMDVYHNGYQS